MTYQTDETKDLLARLVPAVQRNCDIADARHAGDYTLCTYLLKMREYYQWLQKTTADVKLDKKALGDWIYDKEQSWDELEECDYGGLEISGELFEPFDSEGINAALNPCGLIYAGGLGRLGNPIFFIGSLYASERLEASVVLTADEEYARGLTAPPAMANEKQIFVRRDALRRYIHASIDEWSWQRPDNAMAKVVELYKADRARADAVEKMIDHETENVILHEIGEHVAGELIGPQWQDMLRAVVGTQSELLVRAVRDNLADCLSALPALLHEKDTASIYFYFANLSGARKQLFPALFAAYKDWQTEDSISNLKQAVVMGQSHWLTVANHLLSLYKKHGKNSRKPIEGYLAGCCL